MPVMGEHQREVVLLPIPQGFRLVRPFCFSALSAQHPLLPMGTEGEGAAAPLSGLGGSRELGLF